MIFITLIKFKKNAKDVVEVGNKVMQNLPSGVKIFNTFWTLGRFDSIWIYEAPSEKEAAKLGISVGDVAQTETLLAIPREDALELL